MKVKKIAIVLVFALVLSMGIFSAFAVEYDVNKDGKTDVSDVTSFQKYIAKFQIDINVIDANGDGVITIKDATYIQYILVGGDKETTNYTEAETFSTESTAPVTDPTEETSPTETTVPPTEPVDPGIGRDTVDAGGILTNDFV